MENGKIDNLSYWEGWGEIEEGYWYSSGKVWIREGDRKRITEFCHNGKEEPRAAIARWQSYSKDRKEIDEIDSEMAMVPELPKDFDEFVDREVLPQYLFYDAGRKVTKGYCTHCGREVKSGIHTMETWGNVHSAGIQLPTEAERKAEMFTQEDMQDSCRKQRGICIPIF